MKGEKLVTDDTTARTLQEPPHTVLAAVDPQIPGRARHARHLSADVASPF